MCNLETTQAENTGDKDARSHAASHVIAISRADRGERRHVRGPAALTSSRRLAYITRFAAKCVEFTMHAKRKHPLCSSWRPYGRGSDTSRRHTARGRAQ